MSVHYISVAMTAYCCTLVLFLSVSLNASQDFIDCFTSHRNVRVTCVKPAEKRSLLSASQCEELCLTLPKVCRTALFDAIENTCEIFSSPPLLGLDPDKSRRRQYRDVNTVSADKEKCAPALQPSIGCTYLIPREECFEDPKLSNYPSIGNMSPTEEKSVSGGREQRLEQKPPRDPFSAIPVEVVLPIVPDCPIGEKARVQIIDGVEVKDRLVTSNHDFCLDSGCVVDIGHI
ncbi:unnamed protein product [Strongylus vulgaris]|uniref:Apple domain-containing protein n=1 Tax=Strongylus vulgaris TaxID=40348 RepID=A0A3P7LAH1_STRVU|nr:unnamed protein product [Strongylus vulgaris]